MRDPVATPERRPPERRAFEAWVEAKRPEAWRSAAARAMRGWAIGREVTEAEFDEALEAAGAVRIGYFFPR
jgi:hypothetical protein